MVSLNKRFEKFIRLVRQLQNDLSVPSDFARHTVWPEAQKDTLILCLRPPNARGLPLTTLHDIFLCFQHEISRPLPTTETMAVQIVTWELCSRMGGAFEDEISCGKVFDECVSGILEKGETDCELKPHLLSRYDKIDRCIQEADVPIALCKNKLEFGQGESDPYMQIAHCYNLVVEVLSYDGKYSINNIISFLFYIITNFSILNSCCLLL